MEMLALERLRVLRLVEKISSEFSGKVWLPASAMFLSSFSLSQKFSIKKVVISKSSSVAGIRICTVKLGYTYHGYY